jgi:hypothetical protein
MTNLIWLAVAVVCLAAAYVAAHWQTASAELDNVIAMREARHGHAWQRYGDFQLCLTCGYREQVVYDQDLDGTDLAAWDLEVES